jgi:hypothetical protein
MAPTSSEWSFSLRTGTYADSDDSDSDSDATAIDTPSKQTQLFKDLDLSSREDTAQYKPNPFSIAKVNAALRKKTGDVTNQEAQPLAPQRARTKPTNKQQAKGIPEYFKKPLPSSVPKAPLQPLPPPLGLVDQKYSALKPSDSNVLSLTSESCNLPKASNLGNPTSSTLQYDRPDSRFLLRSVDQFVSASPSTSNGVRITDSEASILDEYPAASNSTSYHDMPDPDAQPEFVNQNENSLTLPSRQRTSPIGTEHDTGFTSPIIYPSDAMSCRFVPREPTNPILNTPKPAHISTTFSPLNARFRRGFRAHQPLMSSPLRSNTLHSDDLPATGPLSSPLRPSVVDSRHATVWNKPLNFPVPPWSNRHLLLQSPLMHEGPHSTDVDMNTIINDFEGPFISAPLIALTNVLL